MSAPVLDMARSGAADESDFFAAGGLVPTSRLVRQEVALGLVRQLVPSKELIGLQLAPFKEIKADDFVIQLANGTSTRMAPARADDAESELFQNDDFLPGEYRGRTVDWALKSRYNTSDINTHRDAIKAAEKLRDSGITYPFVDVTVSDMNERIAEHTVMRREALDMRLNWLIMESLVNAAVAYNDGKIKFAVNWGRPAAQHHFAPASGTYASTTHDPVADIQAVKTDARRRYGISIKRAICSQEYLDTFWLSEKFRLLAMGVAGAGAEASDLPYIVPGWGPDSAVQMVERITGVKFTVHDSVYMTRDIGSQTFVNNRWFPIDDVLFLPDEDEINTFDETGLGLGKMLTSPHVAGNNTPGFYAWEKDYGQDPWGYALGTGIKAFPVFPHMNKTYNMKVTLPTWTL